MKRLKNSRKIVPLVKNAEYYFQKELLLSAE